MCHLVALSAMTENRSATVLALNSGSSSLKFGLYRVGTEAPEVVFSGEADLGGGSTNRSE
jgi:acetate kinase